MTLNTQRIPEEFIEKGLGWDSYLERCAATRELQKKRRGAAAAMGLAKELEEWTLHGTALVLGDEGCPDCAWAIPFIAEWLERVQGLEVRYYLRADVPELQELMKTGEKRSVPKLSIVDDEGVVRAEWGPRPAPIQTYVEQNLGVKERTQWFPRVLAYYREEGPVDLAREIRSTLKAARAQ